MLGLVLALMRLSSVRAVPLDRRRSTSSSSGPARSAGLPRVGSLPLAFPGFELPGGVYGSAALGLGLVAAAYMAETIRAGIQAVPKGQMEAARSLGMSHIAGDGLDRHPAGVPDRAAAADQRADPADQGLVAGLHARRDGLQQVELTKFGRDVLNDSRNLTPLLVAGLATW